LTTSTSVTTLAPDDEPRSWHEIFDDTYDSENCQHEKTIMADHRNQLKLIRAETLFQENKLPQEIDLDILWLDRDVIQPL